MATVRTVNRVQSSDGVSLAVAVAGDRSGPVVVLVHGYPDTRKLWEPVAARLVDRFCVVAYDVRGAGDSDAPRGRSAYTLAQLGDDFAAVCAAVSPDRPVHLVGHDWGAIQSWEFAADARLAGRIASLTAIAGPALGHAAAATREPLRSGHVLRWAGRLRRSWYIVPLLIPGGPTLAWRLLFTRARWRRMLATVERLPVDDTYPAATVCADGLHGANLYRANLPRRAVRAPELVPLQMPVQLIVPSGDRFISSSYYAAAERVAPGLVRRTVAGSHWAPRRQPERIAQWIAEFAGVAEAAEVGADRVGADRVGADRAAGDRAGVEAGGGARTALPTRRWVPGGGSAQLAGALALITGAGGGIGRATAAALAARGARLVLVDRDAGAVHAAARGLPGAAALVCDVADEAALERLAADVLSGHGVPDVLINNAGIGMAGPFVDTTAADWRGIVDVNLLGVVHGCRLFAPAMIARGTGGQIVNLASAAAFLPVGALTAYATTKAAVLMLSEGLRGELAPHGIGVTAVCPGLVATGITATTRYVGRSPEGQAAAAERATGLYRRRNFTPERVAEAIVAAIAADRPVAAVTPEAHVMRAIARFAPGLGRRLVALEPPF